MTRDEISGFVYFSNGCGADVQVPDQNCIAWKRCRDAEEPAEKNICSNGELAAGAFVGNCTVPSETGSSQSRLSS